MLRDLLAVARGEGSTWAGLPAAFDAGGLRLAGPPLSASDRGWFAVLGPGSEGDIQPGGALDGFTDVRTARFDGGIAIHLQRVSLADARTRLAGAGAPAEALILPVDEMAARP